LGALYATLAKQEDQDQADGLRLLILTGARIGELLSAEWSHFDLDRHVWRKPPSKTKQRRVHHAPLSDAAVEILRRLRKRQATASRFVFPSPSDPNRPRESFRKFWERVRMEAGLGEVVLYSARHTYASQLMMVGVPLHVVGQLMGHSQPATTARYAHLADEVGRAATSKMADIVAAAGGASHRDKPIEQILADIRALANSEPVVPDVLIPRAKDTSPE
jgi:integrase